MRILLVGNDALDTRRAMSRYTAMLARHLRGRGHLVEVMRSESLDSSSGFASVISYVKRQLLFPLNLTRAAAGFDLVHICDQQDSVFLRHTGGVPASITCHDLLAISGAESKFPQQRTSFLHRVRQRKVLRYLQDAPHVVCVSWKTARELAATREDSTLRRATEQRRVVIPNAVEVDRDVITAERVLSIRTSIGIAESERYVLHVSQGQWYKNRPGLLRIFRMVRERVGGGLKLVVAGEPLTPELREFAAANLPQGAVIEVQALADEDLWALYAGAAALLYPSLYDGFGWPLAEAQSCGCPVITSNRAPLTEVAGPAALYIDPRDEAAAADMIAAKLDALKNLRDAGLENAKRFQPEVVFAAYEGFFKGVLRVRRITDVVVAPNEAETAVADTRDR